MLLGIAGVTGVGKSYYKDKIVEELEFEKVKTLTTREMRNGEKNNEDKVFITKKELEALRKEGKIAYEFEYLGNIYAYTKEEIFSNKNTVFEMHYTTIFDFKKICPNIHTIYLLPSNIEIPKLKMLERNLKPKDKENRLLEIEEHYNRIISDEKLRKMFDYTIYNYYNRETDEEVINSVKEMLMEDKQNYYKLREASI